MSVFNPLVLKDNIYKNCRLKVLPNGEITEILIANRRIFNPHEKLELVEHEECCNASYYYGEYPDNYIREATEPTEAQRAEYGRRARNRAKTKLFDLCLANDFDLFFTLTLNSEKIDRYNYKEIVKKLGSYLDNRVRRKGLKYVIVPETHKDGAYHFHGLCNSEAVRLIDSGKVDKEKRTIFNIADWKLGFTTAVKLSGSYGAVCNYISKYITKQYEGVIGTLGGRYYYHGGKLSNVGYNFLNIDLSCITSEVEHMFYQFHINDSNTDFYKVNDSRILPSVIAVLLNSDYSNI